MASIEKKGDSYRLRLTLDNGRRVPLTVGNVPERTVKALLPIIEEVESFVRLCMPLPAETLAKAMRLSADIQRRMERLGMLPASEPVEPVKIITLGQVINEYVKTCNVTPQTLAAYNQAIDWLGEAFGRNVSIASIDRKRVDIAVAELHRSKLAEATKGKRIKVAKRIFQLAVEYDYIEKNPMEKVEAGLQVNRERQIEVTPADSWKILEQCPNGDWRCIWALSRWGALRCPSEVLRLRWGDVDFHTGRIKVTSPKTAKAGKPWRIIPLFAELRPILEEAYKLAAEGQEYVVGGYREPGVNLRTNIDKIIARAGLNPIIRPFQNARLTRATELLNHYGPKAASEWCGHTEAVAMVSYWQTTNENYQRAIEQGTSYPGHEVGRRGGRLGGITRDNGHQADKPTNPQKCEKHNKIWDFEGKTPISKWAQVDSNRGGKCWGR